MTSRGATRTTSPEPLEPRRLSRTERRDALIDAARALAASGDIADISMESVAEEAGVSRPLVYKHFANADEILAAVYRREAELLHQQLAAEVEAAPTLEAMFAALVRGSLAAAADRGPVFAALRAAGAWNPELRREQRDRDAVTVRGFTRRATRDLDLDHEDARAAIGILLGAIDAVLAQWRRDPTEEHAQLLEVLYLAMVRGALQSVRKRRD
ncbi:MAG TPA: TetR/AcrR family transcriptional regulator [Acidimicrobiia bacterium]|jgi:AcrR family transcriptional regulator|nr:TetR/AcrR family transcriptional regulator [Acidimicrobiia bacterium]